MSRVYNIKGCGAEGTTTGGGVGWCRVIGGRTHFDNFLTNKSTA